MSQNVIKSVLLGLGISASILAFLFVFSIAMFILSIVIGWKIFEKADEPGWKILIPLYNIWVDSDNIWGHGPVMFLYFIPGMNIVLGIMRNFQLASDYGHGIGFGFGLMFLPHIFGSILAFGDSEYEGYDDDPLKPIIIVGAVLTIAMAVCGVRFYKDEGGKLPKIQNIFDIGKRQSGSKEIEKFVDATDDGKVGEYVININTSEKDAKWVLPERLYVKTKGAAEETTVSVKWSGNNYDGNVEGKYRFTAVLPDSWRLADGVKLPYCIVEVSKDGNSEAESVISDAESEAESIEDTESAASSMESEAETPAPTSEPAATETPTPTAAPAPVEKSSFIILGDSRNEALEKKFSAQCTFVTASKGGADWMKGDGLAKAIDRAEPGTILVMMPGTEDLDNAKGYAEAANSAQAKLSPTGGLVYVVSALPVKDEKTNTKIDNFNDALYTALNKNVGYIDLSYELYAKGYGLESDGITLNNDTLTYVYDYIRKNAK